MSTRDKRRAMVACIQATNDAEAVCMQDAERAGQSAERLRRAKVAEAEALAALWTATHTPAAVLIDDGTTTTNKP